MSLYLTHPISHQSGHCFICSTETDNTNLNSDKKNLCERFCILVGRYLNFSIKNNSNFSNLNFNLKKTLSNNSTGNELEIFCCCESCFVELEIFCVFFEQFSLIQLELNARLGKIAQLIKNKKQPNEQNEVLLRKTKFVEKFRHAIVSRVQKGYNNFPRLQLTNLKRDLPTKNESEPIPIQLPQENANGVPDDLIIKEEVTATARMPCPNPISNDPLPFKCRICGKGFAQRKYRSNHETRHTRPHGCNFCGRRFTHKVTLDAHKKIHTGGTSNSQFMCFLCKKLFLRIKDCKLHITKKHNGVGKILKILIKQKSESGPQLPLPLPSSSLYLINYVNNPNPNLHEKGHEDDHNKPMMNPKSATGSELPLPSSNGNPIESVDKPKIIEKCDDDGKPFKCSICGKGFNVKAHRDRHQVIHSEARPHKCQYCGKGFKLVQTLVGHRRTHFGIKPFRCGLCGEKFGRSTYCRAHQKNVHGVTDGVIIKENVDVLNETENFPSSSAPILEGLLLHPNDEAGTAAEGQDQNGHNDLHEDIGSCILPAMEMTHIIEVEQPEHHILYPKIEFLEGENLDVDLCDPLADV